MPIHRSVDRAVARTDDLLAEDLISADVARKDTRCPEAQGSDRCDIQGEPLCFVTSMIVKKRIAATLSDDEMPLAERKSEVQ